MAKNKSKKSTVLAPLNPVPVVDDDEELMNDLFDQLDSRDPVVQQESTNLLNEINLNEQTVQNAKTDAKSRFKARQARKAAAFAQSYSPDDPEMQARLEKEAKEEENDIRRVCKEFSLEIHEIKPDGHCLFSAIADQLLLLEKIPLSEATHTHLRTKATDFIYSHRDDFLPFLPSVGGEDSAGALKEGPMTIDEFENYCTQMRETAVWGGEPEIVALSRAFQIPIHVVQGGKPSIVIHNPHEGIDSHTAIPCAVISYHRKLYGLGEHYNSLRRIRNAP